MLNQSSVRHGWRESVSLHHFQNCNTLIMNHFRNYGVEDELEKRLEEVMLQGTRQSRGAVRPFQSPIDATSPTSSRSSYPSAQQGNTRSACAPSACSFPWLLRLRLRGGNPAPLSAWSSDSRWCTGCGYRAPPAPQSDPHLPSTWERRQGRRFRWIASPLPRARGAPRRGSSRRQTTVRWSRSPGRTTPARDGWSAQDSTSMRCLRHP